jgi:hypothetical protein
MRRISDSDFGVQVKKIPEEIEGYVKASGLTYIEAVLSICEKYDIEPESMKQILPKAIKEKIERDALTLNMLKYKINTVA